jgi:uncharacterized protein YdaU (DUF1376 family)
MASFPVLPLWTDAYIADTAHLTNEEHGIYLRLLMFAWRSPDCDLPDDDKRLAIMVGVSPKKWLTIRQSILPFFSSENGRLTQKRLSAERAKAEDKSRAAAGAASVRWSREIVPAGSEKVQRQLKSAGNPFPEKKSPNALENNEPADANGYADAMPEGMRNGCHPYPYPYPEEEQGCLGHLSTPTVGAALTKKRGRGTRLPDDWNLPPDLRQWALDQGLSPATIDREAATFADYWHARPGKDAAKLDWAATWRNWCRRAIERGPPKTGHRPFDTAAAFARAFPELNLEPPQ